MHSLIDLQNSNILIQTVLALIPLGHTAKLFQQSQFLVLIS